MDVLGNIPADKRARRKDKDVSRGGRRVLTGGVGSGVVGSLEMNDLRVQGSVPRIKTVTLLFEHTGGSGNVVLLSSAISRDLVGVNVGIYEAMLPTAANQRVARALCFEGDTTKRGCGVLRARRETLDRLAVMWRRGGIRVLEMGVEQGSGRSRWTGQAT